MKDFCRKNGGAREPLTEKIVLGAQTSFLWGKRIGSILLCKIASFFIGIDRATWQSTLPVPDQKIQAQKIMFWGEVETAIRSGIASWFGIMGF